MRMFLSVAGHSCELSIANYSSWPAVSQLNVSPTPYQTKLRITNHMQKTKVSTVIYASFIQNSNQMASGLTGTTRFPRVFFSIPASFSAHRAALMTKTDLIFFGSIFFKICRFRSSAFAVSFHSTRSDPRVTFDSGVIFLDQSQFFVTHSNQ